MMTLTHLLESADRNTLELRELLLLAQQLEVTPVTASEHVALHVAESFSTGAIEYETGDRIMNSLFSLVTTKEFWEISDSVVPPLVMAVYQAFDEGEYIHPGDPPDVDLVAKYTSPLIADVLGRSNAV
jgi:hypothetical protein